MTVKHYIIYQGNMKIQIRYKEQKQLQELMIWQNKIQEDNTNYNSSIRTMT